MGSSCILFFAKLSCIYWFSPALLFVQALTTVLTRENVSRLALLIVGLVDKHGLQKCAQIVLRWKRLPLLLLLDIEITQHLLVHLVCDSITAVLLLVSVRLIFKHLLHDLQLIRNVLVMYIGVWNRVNWVSQKLSHRVVDRLIHSLQDI